jgi:hypothetical protein
MWIRTDTGALVNTNALEYIEYSVQQDVTKAYHDDEVYVIAKDDITSQIFENLRAGKPTMEVD